MTRIGAAAAVAGSVLAAAVLPVWAAEPVMVQCGREYQAAKAAGTLNGADWNSYRATCAARLKAPEAAAPQPATAGGPAPPIAPAAPAAGAGTPAAGSPASGGLAAMHARQRQCGAEWRADKPALLARTPGLTWPKYWSQCNARLKAANG